MPKQILLVFIGCVVIYSSLFGIGGLVYGNILQGVILLLVAVVGTISLFKIMAKLKLD